ncbi:MAG: hypothetical protein SGARI_005421 [Bacillariaceae sp.]
MAREYHFWSAPHDLYDLNSEEMQYDDLFDYDDSYGDDHPDNEDEDPYETAFDNPHGHLGISWIEKRTKMYLTPDDRVMYHFSDTSN